MPAPFTTRVHVSAYVNLKRKTMGPRQPDRRDVSFLNWSRTLSTATESRRQPVEVLGSLARYTLESPVAERRAVQGGGHAHDRDVPHTGGVQCGEEVLRGEPPGGGHAGVGARWAVP